MVIWSHPRYVEGYDSNYNIVDFNAPALPTPLSKVDNQYPYRDHSLNYGEYYYFWFNFLT